MRTCRSHGGTSQQEGPARGTPPGAHPPTGQPPHLPLLALRVLDHAEEGDGVVELPELRGRETQWSSSLQRLDPMLGFTQRLSPGTNLPTDLVSAQPAPARSETGPSAGPEDPGWEIPPFWSPTAGRKPQTSPLLLAIGLNDPTKEEPDLQELKLRRG